MAPMTAPPSQLAEELAQLSFTPRMNERLHLLLDKNSEGKITDVERDELESLVHLSETMSLFKAQALRFLGRRGSDVP